MNYQPNPDAWRKLGKTFSIILETENLGMAGLEDLEATLNSLKNQTFPIAEAKEVLVIAGGHVSPETLDLIKSKYPWLQIHSEPKKLEYTMAKMRGAEIATSDIVIFVDSDVIYDPSWLLNILNGFVFAPGATVISGETRIRVNSIYRMAIQLSWMMNIRKNIPWPLPTQHFHLNNFAVYRDVMLSIPFFNHLPIYRANTVEWKKRLTGLGYGVIKVPNARGHHAPPGNFTDWWYRMLIYGVDTVVKADYRFYPDGTMKERRSFFRRLFRLPLFIGFKIKVLIERLYILIMEDWRNIFRAVLGVPLAFVCITVMVLGQIIALFNRDYMYKVITERENSHVV